MSIRNDSKIIYTKAIEASMPDTAVREALGELPEIKGSLILVSIGKAAWQMANAAYVCLGERIDRGIVITKYGHSKGAIGSLEIYEAAHPVPDGCGVLATKRALQLTEGLSENDVVLFLVSGGGSALFECVDFPIEELTRLTKELLASGASIEEINTVRKHLSSVKGGRFAEHIFPASIYGIVLSDVISSRLDMIASGPTVADMSTVAEALETVRKYSLGLTEKQKALLTRETPKCITNSVHRVSGSVSCLCEAARLAAEELGYEAYVMTDSMDTEARSAGELIGSIAAKLAKERKNPLVLIFGGETVVRLRGNGLGGRNQELALSAAKYIKGLSNVAVFSIGSDGTDGPTDAAGGYADGETCRIISNPEEYLDNNDSYNALLLSDGLIFTGATGTNVNDFAAIVIK